MPGFLIRMLDAVAPLARAGRARGARAPRGLLCAGRARARASSSSTCSQCVTRHSTSSPAAFLPHHERLSPLRARDSCARRAVLEAARLVGREHALREQIARGAQEVRHLGAVVAEREAPRRIERAARGRRAGRRARAKRSGGRGRSRAARAPSARSASRRPSRSARGPRRAAPARTRGRARAPTRARARSRSRCAHRRRPPPRRRRPRAAGR